MSKMTVENGIIRSRVCRTSIVQVGTIAFFGHEEIYRKGIVGVAWDEYLCMLFPLPPPIAAIGRVAFDQRTALDNASMGYYFDELLRRDYQDAFIDTISEAHDNEPDEWHFVLGTTSEEHPHSIFVFTPPADGIKERKDYVLPLLTQTREVGPILQMEFDPRS